MKIEYIAHATFVLTLNDGRKLILDPYQGMTFNGRFNYPPYPLKCDFAVVTHDHIDHNYTGDLIGNPVIVRQEWHDSALDIQSVFAWHDRFRGTKFHGYVLMKRICADGVTLCHLGDFGEPALNAAQLSALGKTDIALVPVGGFYTIDGDEAARLVQTLAPRTAIPCHYKTSRCTLPIDDEARFLSRFPNAVSLASAPIDAARLPAGVVRLAPKFS